MSKLTRAFVMSGVAVAAGLTMATAPAMASPAAPSAPVVVADKPSITKGAVKPGATQQAKYRERIHNFYRDPRTCQRVGKIGQFQRKWAKFQCYKVFRGFHRGSWALKVYSGWNFNNGNHGWPHKGDHNGWPHQGNDHNGWPTKGGHDWKKR